jgi:4-pyridoxolactonase
MLVIDAYHLCWNVGLGGPVRFPCYSVLADHPDGKFLFGTGYDRALVNKILAFELPEQAPDGTIPGQLRRTGTDPGEITHVINSRYHSDHVTGNKFCAGAVTLTYQKELAASRHHQPFEHLGSSGPGLGVMGPRCGLPTGNTEVASSLHLFGAPGPRPVT